MDANKIILLLIGLVLLVAGGMFLKNHFSEPVLPSEDVERIRDPSLSPCVRWEETKDCNICTSKGCSKMFCFPKCVKREELAQQQTAQNYPYELGWIVSMKPTIEPAKNFIKTLPSTLPSQERFETIAKELQEIYPSFEKEVLLNHSKIPKTMDQREELDWIRSYSSGAKFGESDKKMANLTRILSSIARNTHSGGYNATVRLQLRLTQEKFNIVYDEYLTARLPRGSLTKVDLGYLNQSIQEATYYQLPLASLWKENLDELNGQFEVLIGATSFNDTEASAPWKAYQNAKILNLILGDEIAKADPYNRESLQSQLDIIGNMVDELENNMYSRGESLE